MRVSELKKPGLAARFHSVAWIVGIVLLTGCGSSMHMTVPPSSPYPDRASSTASTVEQDLRSLEAYWHGTPHRLGGTSLMGVDCSGFVFAAYDELFDLQLPRTTHEQVRLGEEIRPGRWQAGDLIFFKPSKTNHVGIYLGGGEFAHASTSQGVTISRVDEPYWQRAYWTSRRVLPVLLSSTETDMEYEPKAAGVSPRRTGW